MKKPVGVLLALTVVHLTALPGFAQMYRWTDSHGESYLTNDPDQVPDRYRKSVVVLGTSWGAPTKGERGQLDRPRDISSAASQPSEEIVPAAKKAVALKAVDAFRGLESALRSGVTYQDYVKRVADVHVVVEEALGQIRSGIFRGFLNEAMDCHKRAARIWEQQVMKPSLKKEERTAVSGQWDYCSEVLAKAERALDLL
jgi:hypothetical protein